MRSVFNAFAIALPEALLSAGGAVAAQATHTDNTRGQESGKAAATTGTCLTIKTKSSPARHARPDKGKRHGESEGPSPARLRLRQRPCASLAEA